VATVTIVKSCATNGCLRPIRSGGLCQPCYNAQYYLKNSHKIKTAVRQYAAENRKSVLQRKKEYNRKNAEKFSKYFAEYRIANKERIKQSYKRWSEENKDKAKQYRIANKDRRSEQYRAWALNNQEKIKAYYEARKPKRSIARAKRFSEDLKYRVCCNLRARMRAALKSAVALRWSSSLLLLGCSPHELVAHIESQFTDGMSWDNYGYKGWHIDHKRPCASFDLSKENDQAECFNYKNLAPMWGIENIRKGCRVLP
jgi:hypothetical protein